MSALDDRCARAWLCAGVEPGLPAVSSLVERVGASEAVRALAAGRTVPGVRPVHDQDPASTAVAVLADGRRRGLRWLCPGDDGWPDGLGSLAEGPVLHQRGGVPYGLWVRGDLDLSVLCGEAVAVVGSRSSTTYGDDAAADLAAGLGDAGVTVVSGAAYGIDAAAHRGVLAVGGATVAVLACGADVVYPRGHEGLLSRVATQGLVVSEAPPGAHPTKVRFLARNRLIAALARAVVVVEASWRSGALSTLSWGNALHRTCLGVPGPVTSAFSTGVHLALRERRAELVTGAADVREALARLGDAPLPGAATWGRGEARATDGLDAEALLVLEQLPAGAPASVDEVARTTRLDGACVRRVLARLGAAGLAEDSATGWRAVPRRAALPGGGVDHTLR